MKIDTTKVLINNTNILVARETNQIDATPAIKVTKPKNVIKHRFFTICPPYFSHLTQLSNQKQYNDH